MLIFAPKFERIPKSETRNDIISLELATKTIEAINKEIYRDMYRIMTLLPLRPCELRALTWKNVDFEKDVLTINQHFSGNILLEGRKSIRREKKQGTISFKLNDKRGSQVREILTKYRSQTVVSLNSFVFIGRFGNFISEDSLREAWVNARKKLGHKYAAYECRHATASDIYDKNGHDLIHLKEVGGWTNTATLERYLYSKNKELH